jgi:hypothetical protein
MISASVTNPAQAMLLRLIEYRPCRCAKAMQKGVPAKLGRPFGQFNINRSFAELRVLKQTCRLRRGTMLL